MIAGHGNELVHYRKVVARSPADEIK